MTANDPYTPDDYARFTLRMPEELLERIKTIAFQNKRSTGKEIEFILEQWLASHNDEE
jgi:predicted DNA binding CopG/RHH family protein